MGLKLRFMYWWTPNFIIQRELKAVSDQTTEALKLLISAYTPQALSTTQEEPFPKSTEDQRVLMAQTHTKLVEELAAAVGQEKAVTLGREALFAVGVELGKQTRRKLGVSDKPEDLVKAAKILYRILGINFRLEWLDSANAAAIITRCALAERYSKLTCQVLSATDEGVINGLQPNVSMKFEQYMTNGCEQCRAKIRFNKKEHLE